MAAAVALRDDFTGAGLRALARSSRAGNQVRRRFTRVEPAARRRGLAGLACRRFAIGYCGSTPPALTG